MTDLPDFSHPPVHEVSLSVQLEPLPGLRAVDLGLVRAAFADEYPAVEEHQTLPPIGASGRLRFGPADEPPELPRIWLLSADGGHLVQLQRDRIAVNWRRVAGAAEYPRYATIRPRFEKAVTVVRQLADEHGWGELRPIAFEAAYINVVDEPPVAATLAGWTGATSDAYLGAPTTLDLRAIYPISGSSLSLGIEAQVVTNEDASRLIVHLGCIGPLVDQTLGGALDVLDQAHVAIVRGFASFTTAAAHLRWGRVP